MYEEHWKLSARPFENRFSSDYYYPSEAHQAALLKLRYAIENRRSVALVCGSSGMGKSMLLHHLRSQMPEIVGPIIHVAYPALASDQLIQYIAGQLSSDYAADNSKTSMACGRDWKNASHRNRFWTSRRSSRWKPSASNSRPTPRNCRRGATPCRNRLASSSPAAQTSMRKCSRSRA